MASVGSGASARPDDNVAELLRNLNLTSEEEAVATFSDDEEGASVPAVEWALLGKVLSPTVVHATTIQGAMKPAWGNPAGLKIRTIGLKEDNLFVAEFAYKQDMERALGGSPWLVGKHAVILRDYDENLKPSEIRFDRMDIWVRIMDMPLGWMNKHRGERAMGLIGVVKKMDVDKDGKASGPFLRARVSIEVAKPIRRGVLLKTKRDSAAEWFDIQYEKLPYYCSSCGVMGHSHLECGIPLVRNADGKLPYEGKLRVPDPRRKKLQSFSEAAYEAFGSVSASAPTGSRGATNTSGDRRTGERDANLDK
jgi:Flp pilus assembly pilin Flp